MDGALMVVDPFSPTLLRWFLLDDLHKGLLIVYYIYM
jgi:hypothetical protein